MENHANESMLFSKDLKCIAREVLKYFWVVLSLAISAACLSFIAARMLYVPSYTASTTFMISRAGTSGTAYNNMQSAVEIMPTFQTLVNSDMVHKRMISDMGLDQFPGTLSVVNVPQTNLVTLSATAARPDTAFHMIKSLLRVYPEVGEKTLGKVIMEVFDPPKFPDYPDRPFAGKQVMAAAFLFTALLSAGIMAVAFYLKDTVKCPEQVKRKLDTNVFAIVYHEKQYKNLKTLLKHTPKSMRMTDPSISFLYEETMKKISTKLLYKMRTEKLQVVLITSTLPGEGKSTLSMNVAQDLAHRGKNVLLIEGDLQNPGLSMTMHLKQSQIPDWGKPLQQNQNPSCVMCIPGRYGFTALLNSTPLPQAADCIAVSDLSQWIREWKEQFDVILIDAPPVRRRSDAELWARCADCSLLVVRQNVAEAKYINDSIDMLNGYGSGLLGCIYNDAMKEKDFSTSSGYGYGHYGSYGGYGHYGHYGSYGNYGGYGHYGSYGKYKKNDHRTPSEELESDADEE